MATERVTSRLAAVPGQKQAERNPERNFPDRNFPDRNFPDRNFGVIEGRLDLATRVVRFMGTTLLVTFIIGLVGALVFHATIIENQRDLDDQRGEIVRIASDTEAMRSELAELEAPARIVTEAKELGMIEAPSIVYLTTPGRALDDRTLSIAANQLRDNE